MHVFENTNIWDAAKSPHLYFWASKPEFVSHLIRDTESNHLKQKTKN